MFPQQLHFLIKFNSDFILSLTVYLVYLLFFSMNHASTLRLITGGSINGDKANPEAGTFS